MSRPLFSLPLRQAARSSRQYSSNALRRPTLQPRPKPLRLSQRRHGSFTHNARDLFHHHPYSVSLAVVCILAGVGGLVYANYYYQVYIINAYHKYPEPVAQKLRRAIYYTNVDLQPQEALKYYQQALQVADELRVDPFSDEIMGVKIQVSFLMEKIHNWPMAVEVLERVRGDNLKYLELYGDRDDQKERRTRVLAKTIGISVKLADLYAHPSIWERDLAEERLVWAVETSVKEKERREVNNVSAEEEGDFLTGEDVGAAIEALAHVYEEKDQHYLAAPLFLRALSLYPNKDCHQVTLMSNLAASVGQQSPRAAREVQAFANSKNINEKPAGPLASRVQLIDGAKQWALKALDVAAGIASPLRTEECDIGCAIATHNLGEFAEMTKDIAEAERRYREALSLSRAIGFQDGIDESSARLQKLNKRA